MSRSRNAQAGRAAVWGMLVAAGLLIVSAVFLLAMLRGGPETLPPLPADETARLDKKGDAELAYLLVRLEKRTRQVIGAHYTRSQSSFPAVDMMYQRGLAKNGILPATVAGHIFSETVPAATGGRAWVKMVVPEPRNPLNRGDATALDILSELRTGAPSAERSTPGAYYYGEPIQTTAACLRCHGEPKGEPDPSFPQYKKNGWREGEVIGAVIARVAPGG